MRALQGVMHERVLDDHPSAVEQARASTRSPSAGQASRCPWRQITVLTRYSDQANCTILGVNKIYVADQSTAPSLNSHSPDLQTSRPDFGQGFVDGARRPADAR